jgi:hypothetical protein
MGAVANAGRTWQKARDQSDQADARGTKTPQSIKARWALDEAMRGYAKAVDENDKSLDDEEDEKYRAFFHGTGDEPPTPPRS